MKPFGLNTGLFLCCFPPLGRALCFWLSWGKSQWHRILRRPACSSTTFALIKGLPKYRHSNLGKHEQGIPKTGVLFSSLHQWQLLAVPIPWDEWISHPACTAVESPSLRSHLGFTAISGIPVRVWAARHHVGQMSRSLSAKSEAATTQNLQLRHWIWLPVLRGCTGTEERSPGCLLTLEM